jgi:hypothetical protein
MMVLQNTGQITNHAFLSHIPKESDAVITNANTRCE